MSSPGSKLSSSVDIGGGLVVVCMTSFTSMFGVTSYVRLLNCYMGHQDPSAHTFCFPQAFIRQVRRIFRSNEHSFPLCKDPEVGGFHLNCDKVCGDSLPGKVLQSLK